MSTGSTRVLVVDDSAVVRGMLSKIIAAEPGLEMAGSAANGAIGIEKAARLEPDVIVLDIEMPVMSGLEALVTLRKAHPRTPIIMFSTLTAHGADVTLEALSKGASDYATKPTNAGSSTSASEQVRTDLIAKINGFRSSPRVANRTAPTPAVHLATPMHAGLQKLPRALLIGSSTGGPAALEQTLSAIVAPLPVPILIVQHMPPMFTGVLAERLDKRCSFPVLEAEDNMVVESGSCYLAPGGRHMTVHKIGPGRIEIRLDDGPRVKSCRPSVDALFDSARDVYGDRLVAAVLTGMGDDGLDACCRLAKLGVEIIVQDEASSVVWGMPGAVAKAGIARYCLSLHKIAPALTNAVVGPATASATIGAGTTRSVRT